MVMASRNDSLMVQAHILRAARSALAMAMEQFGRELGCTTGARQTIWNWESGRQQPDPERIAAWVNDPRDWVSRLGRQLFEARFGIRVTRLPAGEIASDAGQEQLA